MQCAELAVAQPPAILAGWMSIIPSSTQTYQSIGKRKPIAKRVEKKVTPASVYHFQANFLYEEVGELNL